MGLAMIALVVLLAIRSSDPSPTRWGRFEIWDSALKVFAMNPIFGQGPGAFAGLYHVVKAPREGGVSRFLMDARYAHNEVLETLAAFGLVGFAFLLAWLIRLWPTKDQPWNRASLLGLGAAALNDFCFHTPLIALWGAAFLNFQKTEAREGGSQEPGISLSKGFLVLGLALGLFGPPAFIPALTDQFQTDLQANRLPLALRRIETAENLNPWDSRLTQTKMDFLEKLYLATGDETWKRRADEAQERVLELETTDGSLRFDEAERLTKRETALPTEDNLSSVKKAWDEAEQALPTNAFVKFDKGVFYFNQGPGKTGKWNLNSMTDGATAFGCFEQTIELEPNFAQAWYYSGICRIGMEENLIYMVDFHNAYDVYNRYKSAERIDPLEKLMVSLTPEQIEKLHYELGIK
jgi:tetratricopeptide (TPR) repeat protein